MAATDASAAPDSTHVPGNLGLDPDYPLWPPSLGLLGPEVPRDEWTLAQWREYAEMLERHGHSLIQPSQELQRARRRVLSLEAKLRRSKKQPEAIRTLPRSLLDWPEPEPAPAPRNRGRPRGSKEMERAERAFAKQKAMQAQSPHRRVTRDDALRATLLEEGLGAYQAKKMGGVKNKMSRLAQKEKHKKSLS